MTIGKMNIRYMEIWNKKNRDMEVRNIKLRNLKKIRKSSKYESSKVWNYEVIHGLSFVIIFVFPDWLTTI